MFLKLRDVHKLCDVLGGGEGSQLKSYIIFVFPLKWGLSKNYNQVFSFSFNWFYASYTIYRAEGKKQPCKWFIVDLFRYWVRVYLKTCLSCKVDSP